MVLQSRGRNGASERCAARKSYDCHCRPESTAWALALEGTCTPLEGASLGVPALLLPAPSQQRPCPCPSPVATEGRAIPWPKGDALNGGRPDQRAPARPGANSQVAMVTARMARNASTTSTRLLERAIASCRCGGCAWGRSRRQGDVGEGLLLRVVGRWTKSEAEFGPQSFVWEAPLICMPRPSHFYGRPQSFVWRAGWSDLIFSLEFPNPYRTRSTV